MGEFLQRETATPGHEEEQLGWQEVGSDLELLLGQGVPSHTEGGGNIFSRGRELLAANSRVRVMAMCTST